MARFEPEQLDEIRSQVDIVDIIGRQVALKPAGRNFLGLCPFHQEKTPSFHVHRERQFFHCFGCKASGDVFEFVMQYERLSFPEAVQHLALEAGITLPEPKDVQGRNKKRKREELYVQANTLAAEFYHRNLYSSVAKGAQTYLKNRGITGEMARRFQIGYAPNRWDGLLTYLQQKGVPGDVAVSAGLALQRDGKKPFDLFRNRLIFPITNPRGQVVGFGGRSLFGENPKYINTPQTELFSKREHLYGLLQARNSARREGLLIVCEGYTDVIALAQVGIDNAVASLGTAFTEEQARTLSRWAKEVILAFDSDLAGRSAADRGLDLLAEAGLRVRVAMLPEGEDPDTFVRSRGKEAVIHLLENALPLTEYKIEEALRSADLATIDGRAQAVLSILPVLASVNSAVAREAYVQHISERIGSSPQAIHAELENFLQRNRRRTGDRHRNERSRYTTIDPSPQSMPTSRRPSVQRDSIRQSEPLATHVTDEKTLLWLLIQEPEQAERVYTNLGEQPFQLEVHNKLFSSVLNGQFDGSETGEGISPDIVAAIKDLNTWEPAVVLDIDTYIDRLWERQMRRRFHRLEVELTRLPERDENAYAKHVGSLLLAYKRLRQAVRRRSTND